MRRASRTVGPILTLVFAIAATGLLTSTLVLGLLGAHSAVMWTGTAGCLCLAGWLLAATGRARRRGQASGVPSSHHTTPRPDLGD